MTAFPTSSQPNSHSPLLGANTKRLLVGFVQLRQLRTGTDRQTETGTWGLQLRGSSSAQRC